jgi:elongation factor Ts
VNRSRGSPISNLGAVRAYSEAVKVPFDLIKALRLKTKAGLTDCKDALTASNLDMAKAEDWLKERAKVVAAKKSDRTAAEGVIATITDAKRKRALLLEVRT